MRIVDRPTFLELPAGTLFATYEPCIFGDLQIKSDTCRRPDGSAIDFYTQEISGGWFEGTKDSFDWIDTLDKIQAGEPSPPMDYDIESRDGLFDQDQLFAVWEADDVRNLIARLSRALLEGYTMPLGNQAVDG